MKIELKPCPFCGEKPNVGGSEEANYYIYCNNCLADIGYRQDKNAFSTIFHAATSWNTRFSDD